MNDSSEDLIGRLVADLKPVQPLRQREGMSQMALTLVAGAALVVFALGARTDIMIGRPDPMFLTSSGLFLVLALASAWGALEMARPLVGARRDSWVWTALMAAVLPVAAAALITLNLFNGHPFIVDSWGLECLTVGSVVGTLTMFTLTLWLRRGAPTSLKAAGMLVGVASGAAGIFAVSLCCPANGLIHIGVWHGGTVIGMGLLGRLVLPRFLAW